MKSYKRMRVSELKTEMQRVEDAMRSAIVKDYPGLLQWLLPPPHWKPTKAKMLRCPQVCCLQDLVGIRDRAWG